MDSEGDSGHLEHELAALHEVRVLQDEAVDLLLPERLGEARRAPVVVGVLERAGDGLVCAARSSYFAR